jgi:hypothetical protein
MTSKELVAKMVTDAIYVGRITGTRPEQGLLYQAAVLITTYEQAFETIAKQATPYANATVKRMARMAREAIGDDT